MTRLVSAFLIALVVFIAYVATRRADVWGQHPATTSTVATIVPRAEGVAIDARRRQLIGVRTVRASHGSLENVLRGTGVVEYAEPRVVDINLKVDGWVTDLYVDAEGQPVKRGQPLFRIFSQELVVAQNELIAALRNRDLMVVSKAENAREFGERVLDVPKLTLSRFDVSPDQIKALEETRQIQQSVVFRSTTDGVVIEKSVVPGMYAEHGRTLLRVADLSEVWIDASFAQSDADALSHGAPATVTLAARRGQQFHGNVDRIYPRLADANAKIRARIALRNRDGQLKLGMSADVAVAVSPVNGIMVPSDAIVDSGTRTFVFVAQGAGHFEPRDVVVGRSVDGKTVVIDGLREGEEVVTRATFFIDSESKLAAALQSYDGPTAVAPTSAGKPLDFDVRVAVKPDPPRQGENELEVRVLDAGKRPVGDVDVKVVLSMPAMPTMNMPAMRSEVRLRRVGDGLYRGPAAISMAGQWDVAVSILRDGRAVATSHTTLLAR